MASDNNLSRGADTAVAFCDHEEMANSGSERFGSLVLLKPRPYHKRGSIVRARIAAALGRPYVIKTVLDPTILLKSFIRFKRRPNRNWTIYGAG